MTSLLTNHCIFCVNLKGGIGYSVAFDPLDGSSIIDTNFAVGTIWGTWGGDRLVGVNGRGLKSAGMAVYGPRTTITLAVDGLDYAHEFLLVDDFSARHGKLGLSFLCFSFYLCCFYSALISHVLTANIRVIENIIGMHFVNEFCHMNVNKFKKCIYILAIILTTS